MPLPRRPLIVFIGDSRRGSRVERARFIPKYGSNACDGALSRGTQQIQKSLGTPRTLLRAAKCAVEGISLSPGDVTRTGSLKVSAGMTVLVTVVRAMMTARWRRTATCSERARS